MKADPSLFTGDPVNDLDVSILQDHILEPSSESGIQRKIRALASSAASAD